MSVVLPAPLRPTSPILSPAATRKETSSISRRAPARTSRLVGGDHGERDLDELERTRTGHSPDFSRRRRAWAESPATAADAEPIAPAHAIQPTRAAGPQPGRAPRAAVGVARSDGGGGGGIKVGGGVGGIIVCAGAGAAAASSAARGGALGRVARRLRRPTPARRRWTLPARRGRDQDEDAPWSPTSTRSSVLGRGAAAPDRARRTPRRGRRCSPLPPAPGAGSGLGGCRAVLLSGRRARLPRHRRSSTTCSRASSALAVDRSPAVRARARVRPPRPGPARTIGKVRPSGAHQRVGAPGAAGRLLRRHLDQARHHRRRRGRTTATSST